MSVEELTQRINFKTMEINYEENPERKQKLEIELKKLNYQKEIQIIRDKIAQLDKIG